MGIAVDYVAIYSSPEGFSEWGLCTQKGFVKATEMAWEFCPEGCQLVSVVRQSGATVTRYMRDQMVRIDLFEPY
jgi:hypothetical protein